MIITTAFVVLAFLFARFGYSKPFIDVAERAFDDVRAKVTARRVAQDERIALAVYPSETERPSQKQASLDRALLARVLVN